MDECNPNMLTLNLCRLYSNLFVTRVKRKQKERKKKERKEFLAKFHFDV